jgi:hypothetical protein
MNPIWFVPLTFAVVAFGTIGVVMVLGLRSRRAFQEAARQLGLEWDRGGLFTPGELVGVHDHESVRVYVTTHGYGTLQRVLTIIEIDFDPPIGSRFHVVRESVLDRIAHVLGLHDVDFGDPAFDRLYKVKGEDPERLREVVNPSTRTALTGIAEGSDDVEVTPARLRWQRFGRVLDAHTVVRVVKQGVVVAKAMRHLNADRPVPSLG